MLSRVADSLYWMSRYAERAENIARILDVNLQLMLDLPKLDPEEQKALWEPGPAQHRRPRGFLQALQGDHERERHRLPHAPSQKLELDHQLPHHRARKRPPRARADFARNVGGDQPHLSLDEKPDAEKNPAPGALRIFHRGQERLASFPGHHRRHHDPWRGLGFHPGRQIPRARRHDHPHPRRQRRNFHQRTPANSHTSGTLQWSAILRSCSSHDAYRKFYVAQVEPDKVVEFLILNEFFPRSIRFCAPRSTRPCAASPAARRNTSPTRPKSSPGASSRNSTTARSRTSRPSACTSTWTSCRSSSTPSARPFSRPIFSRRRSPNPSRNRS